MKLKMGRIIGFEPMTSRTTIWRSNQAELYPPSETKYYSERFKSTYFIAFNPLLLYYPGLGYMIRRSSRIAVVQALYQFDMSDEPDYLSILQEFSDFRQGRFATLHNTGAKFDKEFFVTLFECATKHIEDLDAAIIPLLPAEWPIDRLSKTTLAVLRAATTEFKFCLDTPFKVIINEYIEVAKAFGADEKERIFVNGVLNALSDNIRKDEKEHI